MKTYQMIGETKGLVQKVQAENIFDACDEMEVHAMIIHPNMPGEHAIFEDSVDYYKICVKPD